MFGCLEESTQSFTELIEEAKRDLNKDLEAVERKKRVSGGSGSADEEEDNNEEDDTGDMEENEEDAESSDESGEDKGNVIIRSKVSNTYILKLLRPQSELQ